jgi:hypothetical protein
VCVSERERARARGGREGGRVLLMLDEGSTKEGGREERGERERAEGGREVGRGEERSGGE